MLGLFWLAGIMTAVFYAITMHITTLVILREVQVRYWHLLEGGMVTALANINDSVDLYLQSEQSLILYEGPWNIDPRHTTLSLKLSLQRENASTLSRTLKGELFVDKQPCIVVIWYLAYEETLRKWQKVRGEIVYRVHSS